MLVSRWPESSGDQDQLANFRYAERIAREDGVAVQQEFVGSVDVGYNSRRQQIYDKNRAALEARKGKNATRREIDEIWTAAGIEATESKQGQTSAFPGRRSSTRNRRARS